MINSVILYGTIVNGPFIKRLKNSSREVLLFTLEVEREKSEKKDHVHCFFVNDQAEKFVELCKETKRVVVHGSLQNTNYMSNNGSEIWKYEIFVKHANLIRHEEINTDALIIPKEVIDPDWDPWW